jgi:hypothetical protein
LGLGRAAAQAGRMPESKSEYEKFFAVWKDADKDLPVLLIARREYASLPHSSSVEDPLRSVADP